MTTKSQQHFIASLESLTVSQEGLLSTIRHHWRLRKETKNNKYAEEITELPKLRKVVEGLQSEIAAAVKSIQGSKNNQSDEVNLSHIGGWFVDHRTKKLPEDLIGAIEKDFAKISADAEALEKGALAHAHLTVDILKGIDYANDAGFKRTFIDRIDAEHKAFLTSVIKPGLDNIHYYLGTAFLAAHPGFVPVDRLRGEEWIAGYMDYRGPSATVCASTKARMEAGMQRFTREEALRLCEVAQKAAHQSLELLASRVLPISGNEVFNAQSDAYLHEAGEYPTFLNEHAAFMKRYVQMPAVAHYEYYQLFLAMLEHVYDVARYYTQLASRIAAEF